MVGAESVRDLPPRVSGEPPAHDLTRARRHPVKNLTDIGVLLDVGLGREPLREHFQLGDRADRHLTFGGSLF